MADLNGLLLFYSQSAFRTFLYLVSCGVITPRTDKDAVFSGFCRRHKFMGNLASHHSGIRLRDQTIQARAREYLQISVIHQTVIILQALFIGVKAIGVLHYELTAADQAETGADLIPELGLDLIKNKRKLFIRINIARGQMGNYLFMGGAQAHLPAPAVNKTDHYFFHQAVPAGGIPELLGL